MLFRSRTILWITKLLANQGYVDSLCFVADQSVAITVMQEISCWELKIPYVGQN